SLSTFGCAACLRFPFAQLVCAATVALPPARLDRHPRGQLVVPDAQVVFAKTIIAATLPCKALPWPRT
ncbi:MAG: hypothetical protein WDM87_17210, partial [Terracidiphilus sp.]